jgi:hypothetical protein
MKSLGGIILLFFLAACSSNSQVPESSISQQHSTINTPENFKKQSGSNAETALANIVLATAVGVSQKDKFECKKECEQQLKKSLNKSIKNKQ